MGPVIKLKQKDKKKYNAEQYKNINGSFPQNVTFFGKINNTIFM